MTIWVIVAIFLSLLAGFFIAKRFDKSKYEIYIEQAKAKAKAIEHEAEILFENAKAKAKEIELEAKKNYELEEMKLKQEYENKLNEILNKEKGVSAKAFKDHPLYAKPRLIIESEKPREKLKEAIKKFRKQIAEAKKALK